MQSLVAAAGADLHLDHLLKQQWPSDNDYRRALIQRDRLREAYRAYFRRHRIAALMHPAVRMPAPVADVRFISPAPDVIIDGRPISARDAFGANVTPASLVGCPILVLPAGLASDGLPVGLSFEALPGEDDALLTLGTALESILGYAPPPAAGLLASRPQSHQLPELSSLYERGY
jgi:mandelamide amidase